MKYINVIEDGFSDMVGVRQQITEKTEIVLIAHVSNVLGVINPTEELTQLAHQNGAMIVVDGTQAVPHMPMDVQVIDADFYVLSGYRMCGSTGASVLYGKRHLLEQMRPVKFGGGMVDFAHLQESTWKELPWKSEAGTPNITGAIVLGVAIDHLTEIGLEAIHQYEAALVYYTLPEL